MSFWRQLWLLVQGLAMVALAAGVASLFYFLGIPTVVASVADLEVQRDGAERFAASLQRENEILLDVAAYPDEYQRKKKTLVRQLAIDRRILPDEAQFKPFQAIVRKDAAATGVRVLAFSAPKLVPHDYYTEEIVKAELEGSYDAIQAFIRRVEQEERLIEVSRILVTSPAPPYTPQHRIVLGAPVHVTCDVVTFFQYYPYATRIKR